MKPFHLLLPSLLACAVSLHSEPLPLVSDVEWQPLAAQVRRLTEALDAVGSPLRSQDRSRVEKLIDGAGGEKAVEELQQILDGYCLFRVHINPEMRVKVAQGPAEPKLLEQGWRVFLIKVENQSGTTAELKAVSPNAEKLAGSPKEKVMNRWLDMNLFNQQPLLSRLTGLPLEYRLIQLYSRDSGRREARISFNVGQGTQDIGFRNDVDILFTAEPANAVTFHVKDEHGKPTTASFVIRDAHNRVYPAMTKRLAPDFAFHPQIYRAEGETVKLPDGAYQVEFARGPESITQKSTLQVDRKHRQFDFKVVRWIDPTQLGWYSGDHHIHAAGCMHYEKPTEGVLAQDMMRHVLGEDLKVGCNLTWGPCFDYQKQFFTGKEDKVSQYPYLLRYDIEVSGFGSHNSGHLCLLRLQDQMYPGGESKNHWPTLCLNTLRWAKKQGAVCGPAHSGWGLEVQTAELPNYVVPPYSGIGANEYIVDVTHLVDGPGGTRVPAVDFLSTVDTPYVWELNMWYHTLNVGYRTRVSGETDFPCIYGERVGLGRSYVKQAGTLTYDDWCEGIRKGRNYVSDGRSHLINFKVNDTAMGENDSAIRLNTEGKVTVSAQVAARLEDTPNPDIQKRPYNQKPYWDIERARIGQSREVPLEVIVNGYPVARTNIVADGTLRDVRFEVPVSRSSWVALRILPSSHTNPIFVEVGGKPIRASRRSAEWCLKGVDQCWSQKQRHIKATEMQEAREAYDHARQEYRKLLSECDVE